MDGFPDEDSDGEPDGIEDLDGDGVTELDGDCDDSDADVLPGASEVPYDGVDNDCDSATLDDDLDGDGSLGADDCDGADAVDASIWHTDADGEGIFDIAGDCDDSDATLSPESVWFPDADGDGLGDGGRGLYTCTGPSGDVADDSDCDDSREGPRCGGCAVVPVGGFWPLALLLVGLRVRRLTGH